jgi:hypothetical protein
MPDYIANGESASSVRSKINAMKTSLDALSGGAPLDSPAFTGNPTINGYMPYHTGNITVSTSAPVGTLTEGYIHMVY